MVNTEELADKIQFEGEPASRSHAAARRTTQPPPPHPVFSNAVLFQLPIRISLLFVICPPRVFLFGSLGALSHHSDSSFLPDIYYIYPQTIYHQGNRFVCILFSIQHIYDCTKLIGALLREHLSSTGTQGSRIAGIGTSLPYCIGAKQPDIINSSQSHFNTHFLSPGH